MTRRAALFWVPVLGLVMFGIGFGAARDPADPFRLFAAGVLGIVEGLTEYLPVSSTGHLVLAQRALGIPPSAASNAFAICIQAGAIVAILALYHQRVGAIARGFLGGDPANRRLGLAVGTAFLPAAVLGLAFGPAREEYLFGLWPIVAAWFLGGVAILVVQALPRTRAPGAPLEAVTFRMAALIGFAQCLALWPGTSRSLVTIVGGVLVGLSLKAAVEFSFLLGLVTLLAATVYKAVVSGADLLGTFGFAPLALGFFTAALAAFVAVRWLVSWISSHGLAIFGWYRVLLAAVVAALLLTGVLTAEVAAATG
jgi:undecaprenyl-diphosphatase